MSTRDAFRASLRSEGINPATAALDARLAQRRRLRELRSPLAEIASETARTADLRTKRILFETGEAGRGIA